MSNLETLVTVSMKINQVISIREALENIVVDSPGLGLMDALSDSAEAAKDLINGLIEKEDKEVQP